MIVEDFESYAARHGAGRQCVGDAGNHRRGRLQSDKQWKRICAAQNRKDDEWLARRIVLRQDYALAIERGEVREPTYRERLEMTAAGHPESERTKAAIRLLEKRGWR